MDVYWLEQSETDVPSENHWLNEKEAICLRGLRFAKRRADWRLGRWTAKHAVAAWLNLSTDPRTLANIEIRAASSGAPDVFFQSQPADLAISLSHRDRTALCTVVPSGTSIGCDLETIEHRGDAFVADYFTVNEKALIAQATGEEQDLLVALLWSAKESCLKALRVGLRLDTRCICVSPAELWARSVNNTDGWRSFRAHYFGGCVFGGWWRFQDRLVRTVASNLPWQ